MRWRARSWRQGDQAGAQATLRDTWRNDAFSHDLEGRARETFAGLITQADDKARMDMRLYAEDDEAAARAAHLLDPPQLAIAKARAAVINKAPNAKALLDAVPAAARARCRLYLQPHSMAAPQRQNRRKPARLCIAAPRDPAKLGDLDQWWIERRLIARKLLDLNDPESAYAGRQRCDAADQRELSRRTAFHRRLDRAAFPARTGGGTGAFRPHRRRRHQSDHAGARLLLARPRRGGARPAEQARARYESAARYPTAYYGQLARARLGPQRDHAARRAGAAARTTMHARSRPRAAISSTPSTSAI